ncbi:MAG: ATP-dependent Clp protease proteolytic subunit [Akkermansiaceae bacterium]|jgi:ATP-dependent Clp protease protease subunit
MIKHSFAIVVATSLGLNADPVDLTTPLLLKAPAVENEAKPPKKKEKKEETKKPEKKEKKSAKKPKAADKKKEAPKKPAKPAKKTEPAKPAPAKPQATKPAPAAKPSPADAELAKAKKMQERLAILNALEAEKQKHETSDLRAEITKLKMEKELMMEKMAFAAAKQKSKVADSIAKFEAEKEKLTREATLAKIQAEHLAAKLKILQATTTMETSKMMAEVSKIEAAEKRADYANAKPQYLANPLKKDGTLVVSDRRIPFNGPVTSTLADRVTTRINYFNNKDPKKPIFIVIDDSPGGSVMAGYRILKAMEGSEAPVYVVVKSFAASMAATITTLAEKSFVYPNAIILHHQISQSFMFSSMNLTEQKENVEDLKKWWARLADPIAEKMGITSDEFIEMMYQKTVSGDWTEFGDDAVKLKWADHVVNRVHETSLLKNPDAKKAIVTTRSAAIENGLTPAVDENGNPYMILPRKNPKDVYMMHNPDGFYRFK